ncbi:uncharacterized protein I206_104572 [Kwoniella pini CBS 10737]|uniref:Uncharacterized protein n=1 Tax=Kwoniella pini CBS 10737 TaxID=1296096 RepID=A0A1B9I762_9TREE|nr:uncharacterized protein I206_02107 [Kwoniella pini CBS 10737]OCF51393.1 hypothetical protein I206_02107 [Kwoniella pini CBS 10737]
MNVNLTNEIAFAATVIQFKLYNDGSEPTEQVQSSPQWTTAYLGNQKYYSDYHLKHRSKYQRFIGKPDDNLNELLDYSMKVTKTGPYAQGNDLSYGERVAVDVDSQGRSRMECEQGVQPATSTRVASSVPYLQITPASPTLEEDENVPQSLVFWENTMSSSDNQQPAQFHNWGSHAHQNYTDIMASSLANSGIWNGEASPSTHDGYGYPAGDGHPQSVSGHPSGGESPYVTSNQGSRRGTPFQDREFPSDRW